MDQEWWKQQRKGIASAFQPQTVNEQHPTLQKFLMKSIEEIDGAAKHGSLIDFSTFYALLTLEFVGEVAFGTELNAIRDGENCHILQIFHIVLPELMKCGFFPLRAKIPVMKNTRLMYLEIKELRELVYIAVQSARASDNETTLESSTGSKRIFEILALQCGADAGYLFSAEELVDNNVTLPVAGGDPTAHAINLPYMKY
ncbi:hypothetical protein ACEPAH_4046 [Sanghuangporus vaninii]